jgi:hypothetical protein
VCRRPQCHVYILVEPFVQKDRQVPQDKEGCEAQRHIEEEVEELLYAYQVRPYDVAGIVDANVCKRVGCWHRRPLARLQPLRDLPNEEASAEENRQHRNEADDARHERANSIPNSNYEITQLAHAFPPTIGQPYM